jgi:RNA polymerase sigma factor (TIGR02999 family)
MMKKGVTQLLVAWSNGDREALDKLLPLVYDQLRHLASSFLKRERQNHTLQATALVHEAYMRMIDLQDVTWQNRAHFFAIAARVMRRILVNYAYSHMASKRGGGNYKLTLDEELGLSVSPSQQQDLDIAELDEALNRLEAKDERKSRIVELRYFGGLSVEDTAEVLGISSRTVKREWKMARILLYRELAKQQSPQVVDEDL